MKLLKTEIRKNFEDMSDKLEEVFSEAVVALNTLIGVNKYCVPEMVYVKKYGELDQDYAFLQLDGMEAITDLTTLPSLRLFAKSLSCKDIVLNRRLRDFFSNFDVANELIDDALYNYIPLTLDEVNKIKHFVSEAIGNLSICLYYQFSLDDTVSSVANLSELEVDVNVYKYTQANGVDVNSLALQIKECWLEHRPTLPIFEEYPELEELFYEVAGAYVQDFDALEEYVTANDIFIIVNSTGLDIEEKVKEIESRGKKGTSRLSAF